MNIHMIAHNLMNVHCFCDMQLLKIYRKLETCGREIIKLIFKKALANCYLKKLGLRLESLVLPYITGVRVLKNLRK